MERGNAGKVDDVNAVSDGNLWIIKHVTTDNRFLLACQLGSSLSFDAKGSAGNS